MELQVMKKRLVSLMAYKRSQQNKEKEPFMLTRSTLISVYIDDLINKGTDEPYRILPQELNTGSS